MGQNASDNTMEFSGLFELLGKSIREQIGSGQGPRARRRKKGGKGRRTSITSSIGREHYGFIDDVDEVKLIEPDSVPEGYTKCDELYTGYYVDITEKGVHKTEYNMTVYQNRKTGHYIIAEYPALLTEPSITYSSNFKKFALLTLLSFSLTPEQVATFFGNMAGFFIQPSVVEDFLAEAAGKLDGFEQWLVYKLSQEERVQFTSRPMRMGGRRCFLYTAQSPIYTLYMAHPENGREAMETMGILPRLGGLAVHGVSGALLDFPCRHRILQDDLQKCLREANEPWCGQIADLLQKAMQNWKEGRLDAESLAAVKAQYRVILASAAPLSSRVNKFASLSAKALHAILTEREDAVFDWALDNPAEEGKKEACDKTGEFPKNFRSLDYARHICRMKSYLETAVLCRAVEIAEDMANLDEDGMSMLNLTMHGMLLERLLDGYIPSFMNPDEIPEEFRDMPLPNAASQKQG